jgi:D-serine deaminase-like pyridoxal phosphate-dependent protein
VLVDDPAHLTLLSSAAREAGVEIGICLEVDTTWQPIAEVLVGAPRSPIQDSEQARAFAGRARELGGLKVVGVLAWEAAAAALGANVHPWAVGPLKSLFRRRSAAAAADRRGAVVQVLREEGHPIALVSGGSTQTLDLAAADPMLTEVSVGAGFLCPLRGENVALGLRPAVHFAISVARKPDPESLVCAGGGWLSAGPGDGAPFVVSPRNLAPALPLGWGETWTHLRATAGEARLQIGDPVVCRPAKVGPMMERLTQVVLHRGSTILERAPTYRGLGLPG